MEHEHFVTIDKFSELTGYSARAVRAKIHRGDWLRGQVFEKAPDGRILINLEGYRKWVTQGSNWTAFAAQASQQSK